MRERQVVLSIGSWEIREDYRKVFLARFRVAAQLARFSEVLASGEQPHPG
jgi:hypothetical protein